jgi:hypothetical protein
MRLRIVSEVLVVLAGIGFASRVGVLSTESGSEGGESRVAARLVTSSV